MNDPRRLIPVVPPPPSQNAGGANPPAVVDDLSNIDVNRELPLDGDPNGGWTPEVTVKIYAIMDKCYHNKTLHDESAAYHDRWHNRWGFAQIALSLLIAVVGAISDLMGPWFKYVYTLMGLLSTFGSTLQTFLRHQEMETKHRLAAQKFLELYHSIDGQNLFPAHRANAHDYYIHIQETFGAINARAPRPPDVVKKLVPATLDTIVTHTDPEFMSNAPTSHAAADNDDAGYNEFQFARRNRARAYLSEND